MTLWLSLAILAQLITAGTVIIDKYVLLNKGHIGTPVVYAFYVSLLSGFVMVLVPFGYIAFPTTQVVLLSLATAITYILSLILLYRALKGAVPSDVVPVIGAIAAIASFVFGFFVLHQDLPSSFILSFILLIVGTLIISHFQFTAKLFVTVLCAGMLFGLSSVLVKLVFLETTFIDGFFWSRMANVLGALVLLLWPGNWHAIVGGGKHTKGHIRWIVVVNKALSGLAFVLTLRAIQLGSVTIVNALAGLQFIFLFVLALLFAGTYPQMFRAEVKRKHSLFHKLLATLCIAVGMGFLFAPNLLMLL
jgi:drug/metabolite transporter (DMT)-like permease